MENDKPGMQGSSETLSFELMGESFTIKSDVQKEYFLQLLNYLEDKLKSLKDKLPNLSNLKLAILVALDVTDELFQTRRSALDQETVRLIHNLSESLASVIEEE